MESFLGLQQHLLNLQVPYLAVILIILSTLIGGYLKFKVHSFRKNYPPGSLGFPLIGETIGFLNAQKKDETRQWIESRVIKNGSTFKTSLMGSTVVFMTGESGNKFIFSANDAIASNQPPSLAKILGRNCIFELTGSRHRLVRGAMMSFLRPESIQRFVVKMDSIVKQQILQELKWKDTVEVVKLMKKITFRVTCNLLLGLEKGNEMDVLLEDFTATFKGAYVLPLRFPGTIFYQACQARDRVCKTLSALIKTRKKELEEGRRRCDGDIISSFVSLRDEKGEPLSEEEIIDNLVLLIFASHDTATILLTFLIRHFARDSYVYNKVLEVSRESKKGIIHFRDSINLTSILVHILKEQNEITKAIEGSDGKLRWSEMQKMKYTWRVAQEVMRLIPPVFGNFKKITRDTNFGGYHIPKGWQVCWVACSTHMDGKIFKEPEKFDPSRFENSLAQLPPYTYIPFGAGPRACPGSDFARIQTLLTIHYLITNYQWTELIPNEPITREPLPYPAMGLPVRLYPRRDFDANQGM